MTAKTSRYFFSGDPIESTATAALRDPDGNRTSGVCRGSYDDRGTTARRRHDSEPRIMPIGRGPRDHTFNQLIAKRVREKQQVLLSDVRCYRSRG